MKHGKNRPWGKPASPPAAPPSPSLNAVKHGACAFNTLILPTESEADFNALQSRCFKTYSLNPHHSSEGECEMVRAIARAEWIFLRSEQHYLTAEARILAETPDILAWSPQQHQSLQLFQRYKTANFNTLVKARREIENYRKARTRETAQTQTMRHKDERLTMAKERHEFRREKHESFDLSEELVRMKQQAVKLGFAPPDTSPT